MDDDDQEFDNTHRCALCGVTGGGVQNRLCEECYMNHIRFSLNMPLHGS